MVDVVGDQVVIEGEVALVCVILEATCIRRRHTSLTDQN
jgi:hypothetical protein